VVGHGINGFAKRKARVVIGNVVKNFETPAEVSLATTKESDRKLPSGIIWASCCRPNASLEHLKKSFLKWIDYTRE
jgi:hypothetical protein